jgi:hypothetical protein
MKLIREAGKGRLVQTLLSPFTLSGGDAYKRVFNNLAQNANHHHHRGFEIKHPDSSFNFTPYQFKEKEIEDLLADQQRQQGQASAALKVLFDHFESQVGTYNPSDSIIIDAIGLAYCESSVWSDSFGRRV